MKEYFSSEELVVLHQLIKRANNKSGEIIYLQPSDLKYNDNTTSGRCAFKAMIKSLADKQCFVELHYQDQVKCRIDKLVINPDVIRSLSKDMIS